MNTYTVNPIGSRISQWGEGPIWWQNHLYYVDIEGHSIVRLNPNNGNETCWDVGERIGTVVPSAMEDFIYAGDTGFVRFNPATGDKTPMADPEAALRGSNRFNDGKCDPAGRFWAGSISLAKASGSANLYSLDTTGEISLQLPKLTNSNGICWSADAKTLYHIDTPTKSIQAYDFNLASAKLSNRRTVVDTAAQGFASSPDGMTIDCDGNLWVAFCHGGSVACFNPNQDGKVLQSVQLPCLETTACAFGGPKLDRLFVTTGIHKSTQEADAGRVFVIDGLGVKGVPAFAFLG